MTYENLLEEADKANVYVIEKAQFQSKADGLIRGNVIGINSTINSSRKRACILAEELGHYHTAVGDIINQSSVSNRKQEMKGRVWAYNKLIGLTGIVELHKNSIQTANEAAEYLNITEDFFCEALQYYKSKYGKCTTLDNYVIYFEPIAVLELI